MNKTLNQRAAEMMGWKTMPCVLRRGGGVYVWPYPNDPAKGEDVFFRNFEASLDDAAIVERWAIEKYGPYLYMFHLYKVLWPKSDIAFALGAEPSGLVALSLKSFVEIVTATADQRTRAALELHDRKQQEPEP